MQKLRSIFVAAGFIIVLMPAAALAQTFATGDSPHPVPQSESGRAVSGFSGSSGTTAPAATPQTGTNILGEPLQPTVPAVVQPAIAQPAIGAPVAAAMPQVASPLAPAAPVAPANIASTLPGAPPVTQPTVDTQKADPCAQYMYAYNAYVTCQDRMQKIDRMKAANTKRMDAFKAPPPAPPVAAVPANGKTPAANGATPAAATPAAAVPATAAPVTGATPGTVAAPAK